MLKLNWLINGEITQVFKGFPGDDLKRALAAFGPVYMAPSIGFAGQY